MNFLNNMSTRLDAKIQRLVAQSSLPYLEARLHIKYELGEQAHEAHLSLYTQSGTRKHDNRFRGDASANEIVLSFSSYRGENKQFIAALTDALAPDFCYMSEQTRIGFNREGAVDVSARFAFTELLTAIKTIESLPIVIADGGTAQPIRSLTEREAELEAMLQAHYDCLAEDDDKFIYFVCDIDEDKSSEKLEDFVFTNYRVVDAEKTTIITIDEDLFYACAPEKFVGDLETQIFEVEVDEWLRERRANKFSSNQLAQMATSNLPVATSKPDAVAAVVKYLRSNIDDWNTYRSERYGVQREGIEHNGKPGYVVEHEYWARNSFGGTMLNKKLFFYTTDGVWLVKDMK